MSSTLRPRGLWHAWPLCLPRSPRVCSNSCPLSLWCCLTISSSASPFSFCLQFSPLSGSSPVGFVSESVLHIRWPKYWSFSFSNSPSREYSGLISFRKLNSWATIQRSNSFFFLLFFFFNVDLLKNLDWICCSIASLLCFGFLAARHVAS